MPIIKSNILDFGVEQTGTVEALFELALLNGVSITGEVPKGTELAVPAKVYDVRPLEIEAPEVLPLLQLKKRQTVVDFACQHAGTMEALFNVALLNGVGITQEVAPGSKMKAQPVDLKNVAFYKKSVHDITTDKTKGAEPGGIGYMQIGTSFKVS